MPTSFSIGSKRNAVVLRVKTHRQCFVVTHTRPRVTVVGVRGAQGPPGPAAASAPLHTFAFGDATPAVIYTPANNVFVVGARLIVTTPFDGVGAQLKVGLLGNLEQYVAASENNPAFAAEYENDVAAVLNAGTAVYLSITPGAGATQGAGRLLLDVVSL